MSPCTGFTCHCIFECDLKHEKLWVGCCLTIQSLSKAYTQFDLFKDSTRFKLRERERETERERERERKREREKSDKE